ncbi:MAG TPA: hypothetical protein PK471_03805 [Bacteroidales bacterium]|nr:hypothetical protein [Bacteroidales bacterium]HQQ21011.1 hypothetical protein [Bacteroidales bacterium]
MFYSIFTHFSSIFAMNIDQFKAEIAKYQKQLAQPIPTEMNLCIEKISQLGAIHYRTGYLLANARRFLRKVKEEKTKDQIDKKKENKFSYQVQNTLLDGTVAEETYLVELLEMMNFSCTQQIEICRTIISKEKEELRYSGINLPG